MAEYTQGKSRISRFMDKIKISETGCWEWTGYLDNKGYAKFDRIFNGRASRYSYSYFKGEIPEGFTIDHLCRNRKCVNPNHLEAVTTKENVLRGIGLTAQHAKATHCPKGHPYDDVNTYVYPRGRGCRICRLQASREYRARRAVLSAIEGGK